jgi:hypothetical protein
MEQGEFAATSGMANQWQSITTSISSISKDALYWCAAICDSNILAFRNTGQDHSRNRGSQTYSTYSFSSNHDWETDENGYNTDYYPCMCVTGDTPPPPMIGIDNFGHSFATSDRPNPGYGIVSPVDGVSYPVRFLGHGSWTSDQILSNITVDADVERISGVTYYATVQAELNSIFASVSAASIYSDLVDIYDYLASIGYRVIPVTVVPCTELDSAKESTRLALNEMIKDGSDHYYKLLDAANIPELQDPSDTRVFSDGIHYTAIGSSYVSAHLVKLLDLENRLAGSIAADVNGNASANTAYWGRYRVPFDMVCTGLGFVSYGSGNAKLAAYSGTDTVIQNLLAHTGLVNAVSMDNIYPVDNFELIEGQWIWIEVVSDAAIPCYYSANAESWANVTGVDFATYTPSNPVESGLSYFTNSLQIAAFLVGTANTGNDCTIDAVGDGDIYSTDMGIHIIGTGFNL